MKGNGGSPSLPNRAANSIVSRIHLANKAKLISRAVIGTIVMWRPIPVRAS